MRAATPHALAHRFGPATRRTHIAPHPSCPQQPVQHLVLLHLVWVDDNRSAIVGAGSGPPGWSVGAREPAVSQLLDRAMIGAWRVSGLLLLAFAVAVDLRGDAGGWVPRSGADRGPVERGHRMLRFPSLIPVGYPHCADRGARLSSMT